MTNNGLNSFHFHIIELICLFVWFITQLKTFLEFQQVVHASILGIITTYMSVGFNTNIPYTRMYFSSAFQGLCTCASHILIRWTHIQTFCSNSRPIYRKLVLKYSIWIYFSKSIPQKMVGANKKSGKMIFFLYFYFF